MEEIVHIGKGSLEALARLEEAAIEQCQAIERVASRLLKTISDVKTAVDEMADVLAPMADPAADPADANQATVSRRQQEAAGPFQHVIQWSA